MEEPRGEERSMTIRQESSFLEQPLEVSTAGLEGEERRRGLLCGLY